MGLGKMPFSFQLVFYTLVAASAWVRLGANYGSALPTSSAPNFNQFLLLESVRRSVTVCCQAAHHVHLSWVSIYVSASEMPPCKLQHAGA